MGTVEDPTVPILKKGCFYECCSNGGNVMKTTKHMTIRQKLNTERLQVSYVLCHLSLDFWRL